MNRYNARPLAAILTLVLLAGCTASMNQRSEQTDRIGETRPPSLDQGKVDRPSGVAIIDPSMSQAAGRDSVPSAQLYPGTGRFVRPGAATAAARPTPMLRDTEGNITLNFAGTDIGEVVRTVLGETLGLNYTIDPDVSGTVTLRTHRPVPQEALLDLLEAMLTDNNLALVEDGDLYRVIQVGADGSAPTAGSVAFQPRQRSGYGTEIFPLRHTNAADLQTVAQSLLGPQAQISVDETRNFLIVTGSSQQRQAMQQTIDMFDTDWMAGMSYGLLPVTSADPSTIIAELEAIYGLDEAGPLAGQIRFIPIERLGVILTVARRPADLVRARQWVERLDRGMSENGRRLYVYYAQHARAEEMVPILQDIFQSRGTSSSAGRTGSRPGDLATNLDPVRIQSPEGGMSDTSPGATGGTSTFDRAGTTGDMDGITDRSVQITADETNNAVFILATPRDFRLIEAAIENLDLVPLQVLIEATIAEVTLNDELRYGVQWFLESGDHSATFSAAETGNVGSVFPGFSYLLDGANARVVLNALTSVTDVNVISSPQLMVLDNRSATLQVGDQVPVATQSAVRTTDSDAPIVNQIEFRDTGVILKVTPRVNASGTVNMDIEQEVSDVVPTTSSGIDSPTIRQRRISSTVAIRSGQTIALGGLIRDSVSDVISGVPLLSDVPILGNLFKTTGNNKDRTELLVLITPLVIRDDAEALALTEQLRRRLRALQPLVGRIE